MPTLRIPCIRQVVRKDGGGTSVEFAFQPGEDGGGQALILIKPEGSPIDIAITPFFPYVLPVPDFGVITGGVIPDGPLAMFNDLVLNSIMELFFGSKSKIELEKEQIQKFLTQPFRYAFNEYGYPLTDDHSLIFKSSGVRREFLLRPDLAILAEAMWTDADAIVTGAFNYKKSYAGIRERLVNQFLANAAYNNWPVQATLDLWHGIVRASVCIAGVPLPDPNAPPLPLPPNPPPPGQPAQCPPGYTPEECQVLCGRIRQLTAGQQPLPPEITAVLQYFPDCVLPPDGSWQYLAPDWRQTWDVGPISAFPWADQASEIRFVPPWAWPYNWPQDGKGVWEITSAPQGARFPEGSLFVMGRSPDQYAILPNGQLTCFYPPVTGIPDPPDPDDPPDPIPPPDLSAPLAQLRLDFELLRADYQQFKQVAFQSFDSLKKAVWDSFCRSNMQAAEVYATAQGGWQGPPPGVQCLEIPAAWQSYPAPGNPQVLELPPIQPFPQAPAPQPVDLTGLQRRLDDLQEQERQINLEIDRLQAEIPLDIDNAINRYDQNVEKPDLQKLRDECCQPPVVPEEPGPVDYCQLGRDEWGRMAECWLEATTEDIPDPIAEVRALWSEDAILNQRRRIAEGQLSDEEVELRDQGRLAFLSALNGQFSNAPGIDDVAQRPWIFNDPSVLEVPPIAA